MIFNRGCINLIKYVVNMSSMKWIQEKNDKIKLMKKMLIWFRGGNKKYIHVKWIQFINFNSAGGGGYLDRTRIWSIGGINKQRQNLVRLLILCHVMARKKQLFFKEFSSTINQHDGVNYTFWCQGFPLLTYIYSMTCNHAPSYNVACMPSCI